MKKEKTSIFRSVILEKLYWLTDRFYSLLINGFLGKIFTAYSAEEEGLLRGRLFSRTIQTPKKRRISDAVRLGIARVFENSFWIKKAEELGFSLIYRKLKTYGALFLSFGAYGIMTYVVKEFAVPGVTADIHRAFFCAGALILSFPMMSSKETLAESILNSRFLAPILFEGLGVPRDTFTKDIHCRKRYGFVTAVGMLFGVLTYYVDPVYYLAVVAIAVGIFVVSQFPEIGIIGWIATLPFSGFFRHPTILLVGIVSVTGVSYLVKLIRGKRVFRMKLMDYVILLFLVLYLLGGFISAGGLASLGTAVVYTILLGGYFLVFNLMRTREWVRRCAGTAALSGTIACLFGVTQIFTGTVNPSWIDTRLFAGIGTRITSTFENPNVFAEYLLLVIPIAAALLFRENSIKEIVAYVFSLGIMLVCLVFTWSRGAWLGFLVGAVLFFMILSRRTLIGLFGLEIASPLLVRLIPSRVSERFLSIGNVAESSASYRISAWYGVGEMLKKTWWGGIGVGSSAFGTVYPAFAYAGVETLEHAHSIYLQLMVELGLPGLIVFCLIMFLFAQNCFEYLFRIKNREGKGVVMAGIASVTAMLVIGMTDHIFYNFRIFLAFWTTIGVVNAYIKTGFSEADRHNGYENNTQYAAALELDADML